MASGTGYPHWIDYGYTHAMMDIVSEEASKKGYEPDALVTPEDVGGKGRPAPYMIFRNMQLLGIEDVRQVIKVGDTASDMKEGKNAGVFTIGVLEEALHWDLVRKNLPHFLRRRKQNRCSVHRRHLRVQGQIW